MEAGQIAEGFNLNVRTLDAAIATGQKILSDNGDAVDWDGLEIWLDHTLLYKSSLR